jgi:hypothetical protein
VHGPAGLRRSLDLPDPWHEDVPVLDRLFERARVLAKDVVVGPDDPPLVARWLEILSDGSREGSDEREDTLRAVAEYFGLSTIN